MCVHQRIALYNSYFYYDDYDYDDDGDDVYYYWTIFNTIAYPVALMCPVTFVLLRLDYCGSLFADCPKYLLSKLHKVKNKAARLKFRTIDPPTSLLCFILFIGFLMNRGSNTSCLCFKVISLQVRIYHSELLHL